MEAGMYMRNMDKILSCHNFDKIIKLYINVTSFCWSFFYKKNTAFSALIWKWGDTVGMRIRKAKKL